MKFNPFLKSGFTSLVLTVFLCANSSAQLSVLNNSNATDLAARLVGPGVTISGAVLKCPNGASGTFETGPTLDEVGIPKGILLTSGQASSVAHVNDHPGDNRFNNGGGGNADLNSLLPGGGAATFDACVLEFDLEAAGNQVSFEYVFASEEYEEYYCSPFNDVFGFLISGPNPSGGLYNKVNIALIPGTSNPVSINTVGPPLCGTKSPTPGVPGAGATAFYESRLSASTLQYDGKTVVLTAKADLKPCQTYHFILGVEDVTDAVWDSGVFLKEGSFRSIPPTINCPAAMNVNSDPNLCAAKVNFTANASGDCPPITTACNPPSGSLFPVGATTVTCKATDRLGNTNTCTFTITVKDAEKPMITCPPNVTVSCEASTLPSSVGLPTATDNCGVSTKINADATIPGSCTHEFTLNRTWTAKDIYGNTSSCLQVIKVEDKKPPVLTCPPNITVTCDTSVAKTGMATAIDNCDPTLPITRHDVHIFGDCDWYCIVDRHWSTTDDCRNTSQCVQTITKDVTPLIDGILAGNPLVLGQDQATVTVPPGRGACVVQWLPYSGTVPKELKFDDAVAGADCALATNPIDASGHIVNPLLGEVLKLSILARINPAFGTKKLNTFSCTIHFVVLQALKPNPDVNELLRVANLTLGNINFGTAEHKKFLLDALKCIGAGLNVCNIK